MIELIIRHDPQTGAINIHGPLQHKTILKGMLLEAASIIDRWHAEQAKKRIVPASGPIPPFPGANGGLHA